MPKYRVTVAVTVTCGAKDREAACASAASLVRETIDRHLPTPAKVEWIGVEDTGATTLPDSRHD